MFPTFPKGRLIGRIAARGHLGKPDDLLAAGVTDVAGFVPHRSLARRRGLAPGKWWKMEKVELSVSFLTGESERGLLRDRLTGKFQ
jgi:hypothetical protein